jgi:hypothetical protein
MCDETGERYAVERSKIKRARKPARCCACREAIRVGERYHHFDGLYDGAWYCYRQCLVCQAHWQAIASRTGSAMLDLDCGEEWIEAVAGESTARHIAGSSGIAVLLEVIEATVPAEVQALAFALPRDFGAAP